MEKITLLIPAYNEAQSVEKCLKSILGQTLNKDYYAVIVIVNGSTDGTEKVVKRFLQENKLNRYKILVTPKKGKASALNLGLHKAQSEIIACVDADCELEDNVLEKVFDKFKKEHLRVIGALDLPNFKNKKSLLYEYQITNQIYREERGRIIPIGRFCVFYKEDVGSFPEGIHSEDTWLALTLASKYGWGRIKVFDDIKVHFNAPDNWLDFIKQESRFESGFKQLIDRFPRLERTWEIRREHLIKKRSDQEIFKSVYARLRDLGIKEKRLDELYNVINVIIEDNSRLMANDLIGADGTFDPVSSTKI